MPIAVAALILMFFVLIEGPKLDITSICFSALGGLYVLFSYASLLPLSWAPFRNHDTIARQAHYIILFPFFVIAFRTFFDWCATKKIDAFARIIILLGITWVPVCIYSKYPIVPHGLGNDAIIAYSLFAVFFFRWKIPFLLFFTAVAIGSDAAQNILLCGTLVLIRFVPFGRAPMIAALIMPFLPLFFLEITAQIYAADANSGVRLMFLGDAVRALTDTWGIGVGFGTQGIQNFYPFFSRWFLDPGDPNSNLYNMSVHNSVFGVGMRMGLGFFALYAACGLRLLSAAGRLDGQEKRVANILCVIALMAITTDVAIESPTYSVGLAFTLAFLDSYIRSKKFRLFLNARYVEPALFGEGRRACSDAEYGPEYRGATRA